MMVILGRSCKCSSPDFASLNKGLNSAMVTPRTMIVAMKISGRRQKILNKTARLPSSSNNSCGTAS